MDLTPNYGLGKPLGGESYDVEVPNTNMDALDLALDGINDRLTTAEGKLPVGVTPSAKVISTSNQPISNNTTENFDMAGGTGTETLAGMLGIATDRLTIKRAGYYIVSFRCVWPANSTGYRYSAINKGNPGPVLLNEMHLQATANTMTTLLHTPPTKFEVDDWVFASVNQNSGGVLNLNTGSFLQATWIAGP